MYRYMFNGLIFFAAIACSVWAHAHSGGTDAFGRHHDRKNGGYHCHKANYKGMSFSSKVEAEKYFAEHSKTVSPTVGTKMPASVEETAAGH